MSSGTVHGLSKWNSKRNKCTANHTDFIFPMQLKQANSYDKLARNTGSSTQPKVTLLDDIEIDSEPTSISGQPMHMSALMEDFKMLQAAFEGCQDMIRTHAEAQEAQLEKLRVEHNNYIEALKSELCNHLQAEFLSLADYVNELKSTIEELNKKLHSLRTQVSFYQWKMDLARQEALPSMPLKDAIVYSINNMVNTKQQYKLLSKRNQAVVVAKGVFDSDLLNRIVIDEVVNESK